MANPRIPRIGLSPRIAIPARPAASPAAPTPPATPVAPPNAGISAPPPIATPTPPTMRAEAPTMGPGYVPADPETSIPLAAPAGWPESKEAAWCVRAIGAHARLRAKSFYDTGKLIARLMELKAVYGAANIKELVKKAGLETSHMTANKYLQIARAFPRDVALRIGIEKCYALIVYAKATRRAPEQAAAILASDEPIRGAAGKLRAGTASASAIYVAIKALKDARKMKTDAAVLTAERQATADRAEKLVRLLGFKGASATVIRRGGEARITITIPLETASSLEQLIPRALPRAIPRLAKTSPEAAAALRAAGWRARSGSG